CAMCSTSEDSSVSLSCSTTRTRYTRSPSRPAVASAMTRRISGTLSPAFFAATSSGLISLTSRSRTWVISRSSGSSTPPPFRPPCAGEVGQDRGREEQPDEDQHASEHRRLVDGPRDLRRVGALARPVGERVREVRDGGEEAEKCYC